jgi:hypothetical protein
MHCDSDNGYDIDNGGVSGYVSDSVPCSMAVVVACVAMAIHCA